MQTFIILQRFLKAIVFLGFLSQALYAGKTISMIKGMYSQRQESYSFELLQVDSYCKSVKDSVKHKAVLTTDEGKKRQDFDISESVYAKNKFLKGGRKMDIDFSAMKKQFGFEDDKTIDNFGNKLGINLPFAKEWLAFLAYMEVGDSVHTFRSYPTLSHKKYKMAVAAGSEKFAKNSAVSTACGPWGITDGAFYDVMNSRDDFLTALKADRDGSEVLEWLEQGGKDGFLEEITLTALLYHRIAIMYRKDGNPMPSRSIGYFMHSYSCHYNPKQDKLSTKQKDRINEWFTYPDWKKKEFNIFN